MMVVIVLFSELVFFNWKQLLIIDGNAVTSPNELVFFNWKQTFIVMPFHL